MNSRDRADDLRLRQNIAQDWLTHGVRAVFSDETEQYRTPFEPKPHDTVRVKIRTGKNSVDKVILVLGGQSILMKKAEEKGVFQYYDAVIEVGTKPVSYYFVLYGTVGLFLCRVHQYCSGGGVYGDGEDGCKKMCVTGWCRFEKNRKFILSHQQKIIYYQFCNKIPNYVLELAFLIKM